MKTVFNQSQSLCFLAVHQVYILQPIHICPNAAGVLIEICPIAHLGASQQSKQIKGNASVTVKAIFNSIYR